MTENLDEQLLRAAEMSARQKYRLMTSVIVPRPIGWLSTRSAAGVDNLAPFSYFGAFSSEPMIIGVAIGHRGEEPKDSLVNIRETGAFCTNMVTEKHVEAMNQTAGDYPAGVSEFDAVDVPRAEAETIAAAYVADCPVVMECTLFREVDLGGTTALILGEIQAVRLGDGIADLMENDFIDTSSLKPVGRLWAGYYSLVDDLFRVDRPKIDRETGEEG